MAKAFNLTGDVSLEDVNFSSTAARGSRQLGTSLDATTGAAEQFTTGPIA
jgi:hypothetical protein